MIDDKIINNNHIVLISGNDEDGKLAAEFLHNESSKTIYSILLESAMSANDIYKKTGYGLNLINHHVTKMRQIGVVEVCRIDKNSKNHDVKIYRAKQYVILPDKESTKRARKSKTFQNNLHRILRLTFVGLVATATWVGLQPDTGFEFSDGTHNVEFGLVLLPIIGTLVVVVFGVVVDLVISRRKKNKSQS